MNQILLITDGCSNVGVSPVVAAAQARTEGIVVNVVGVVHQGEIGERGAEEIADIARAGGGMSRIVEAEQLPRTVQMMTRQTIAQTLRQAMNRELRQFTGGSGIGDLPPDKRAQLVEAIDEWSETAGLRVALLTDTSASMKPKFDAVRSAVRELMLSLQARTGSSELAVFRFPGSGGEVAQLDAKWTRELAKIPQLFYNINMKGTTPTGPALLQAIRYFGEVPATGGGSAASFASLKSAAPGGKDGVLSDYIV